MRSLCLALCAFAFATPVMAQDNQLPPRPIAAKAPADSSAKKDKLVCESMEATGSRLGKKKICMTKAQWIEQNELDRREVERVQANRYKGD